MTMMSEDCKDRRSFAADKEKFAIAAGRGERREQKFEAHRSLYDHKEWHNTNQAEL